MAGSPRKRQRRYVETTHFLAAVARLVTTAGRRVGESDVDDLRQLLELERQVDTAIVRAVAGLRQSEVTWEEIGAAAGTTRQAALMRWQPKIDALQRNGQVA
jgi:hypothetical protein